MRELHLFAGAGGGILGGILLGHTCVCAVEIEPYRRQVLLQRQRDGILPKFPIWDDVRTFDGKPWRGRVDIVAGGFPCGDISAANAKAIGIGGERSGLWEHMARIIGEIRPRYIFVENSPLLVARGLALVLRDFARMGYDAVWGVLGARHAGAPIKRDRIWLMGKKPNEERRPRILSCKPPISQKSESWWPDNSLDTSGAAISWLENRHGQPALLGSANGLAHLVDELEAAGDGQVPSVAALAWRTLGGSSVVNGLRSSNATRASSPKSSSSGAPSQ